MSESYRRLTFSVLSLGSTISACSANALHAAGSRQHVDHSPAATAATAALATAILSTRKAMSLRTSGEDHGINSETKTQTRQQALAHLQMDASSAAPVCVLQFGNKTVRR
jgi:hypothetical protein